ncbi:MAG: TolC family protein [Mariniphaga sp.]|nr:TolC family protein [Mariniphaga sp.]
MRTNKYILVLILVAAAFLSSAQEPLDKYLVTAAENNPGLKARFNDYLSALEKAPQVKALPDPQVAFGFFIQPVETRMGPQQFKLSASQMFPWFGVLKAREDVAVQAAKAKFELFLEAKAKLFNDVRSTWFNLYFTKKAIGITSENLDILNSFQRMALIKVEAGKVSVVDEFRIELEMGELKNQLALLNDNFYAQLILFNNLLNVSAQSSVEITDELWETGFKLDKSALLDSVLAQNHQLLKLELERELAGLKMKVAELNSKPDFSVGFDYINIGKGESNLAGTDAFVFPKIGVSIPLFRKKYEAMVKEVAYMEKAKQFEKEDKSNSLESLFEMSYRDYTDAGRRILLYRNQTDLANKSLKILETEYATSSKNFEELLRMERLLLKYALELEKAKTDKQAAISFITYLMGN